MLQNHPVRLAVFASGAGSNAEVLINQLNVSGSAVRVVLVACNKPGAGVIGVAERHEVPVLMIERERFFHGDGYVPHLQAAGIGGIVLAGFLWKVPSTLLKAFPHRIINIHPALLPKFGGKGMYGNRVHQAVIDSGELESGITIHYVDDAYDHGATIFQARCPVLSQDNADTLAARVHELEHLHYAGIARQVFLEPFQDSARLR